MRRSLFYATLCALMLALLCACAPQQAEEPENAYTVYYPAASAEAAAGGDAVVPREVVIDGGEELTRQALAEALVRALLDPPDALSDVVSPLPAGTQLNAVVLSGRRARVDLTGGYGSLSPIDMTLTDSCLALTLTQLENVDGILVTEQGRQLPYRAQVFTAADALLGSMENPLRTFTAYLWYAEGDTLTLCAERQTMLLREGETRLDVLLETLLLGPELEAHTSLFPEGFRYLSARAEEGVCYLNLPADVPLPEGEETQRAMLEALVRTLCSLDSVDAVQVVLDGENAPLLGTLDISAPLSPQTEETAEQSDS